MTVFTLLAKIHKKKQKEQIEKILDGLFEGLDAKYEIRGLTETNWVQIEIMGEDELVASKYLGKSIGFSPEDILKVQEYRDLEGFIESQTCNNEVLLVDVGIFTPGVFYGKIPLLTLQRQLVGGADVKMSKIAELFALSKNMPVYFKIIAVDEKERVIEGELGKLQLKRFRVWRNSFLDRLLIVGASITEVRRALKQAMLHKDVIDVETLGVLTHALTCKLGTDAAGIVPRVGRILRNASLRVFSPRKISDFLETLENKRTIT